MTIETKFTSFIFHQKDRLFLIEKNTSLIIGFIYIPNIIFLIKKKSKYSMNKIYL